MNNKKIIFQVTKTYMKKNKRRTLITFTGILVMVILMTAVFVGKDTVMDYLQRAVAEEQGSWHYQVYDVSKDEADEIAALSSVEQMEISRPLGYTEFAQSANPETPFLEIKSFSGELVDWMNIRVKEGRRPENANELMISERAVEDGADIRIGDTIEVEAFDRYIHAFYKEGEEERVAQGAEPGMIMFGFSFGVTHGDTVKAPAHFAYYGENTDFEEIHKPTGVSGSYTIVGIMESPRFEARGQGGYAAICAGNNTVNEGERVNLVFTTDLRSKEDTYGRIADILDRSRTEEEREAVRAEGTGYRGKDGRNIPVLDGQIVMNDLLLTFASKGSDGTFNAMMIFFQAFFIGLITAASLVLIYNVFSLSYRERSIYLGMLSSVGATRQQKKWSVYYEVFTLLLMALPGGILLGLLVVKGGMTLLYPHFSEIISTIASNVIVGKSGKIGCHLIVNPKNLLFVAVFSAIAVWLAAWIPALKISRTGPIESIRGNAENGSSKRKKGYKTDLRHLKKAAPERLIAAASIRRNPHSTRGIIRSITVFISLTLVTFFAARSLTDIIRTKTDNEDVTAGEKYKNYKYSFCFDENSGYFPAREQIMNSDEVTDYREMDVKFFAYYADLMEYTEEYREALGTIIDRYYPGEKPQIIIENYLEPAHFMANPVVNMITLSDAAFAEVAGKAGADLTAEHPVLVYDTVSLSTDDYEFTFDGALQPDFCIYEIKKPFRYSVGDVMKLMYAEFDPETTDVKEVDIPLTFAGYVKAEDIAEYYRLQRNCAWVIVSASTRDYIMSLTPTDTTSGIGMRQVLFNTNNDDPEIVRELAQMTDVFGESAIHPASMTTGLVDFKMAITMIINIVAVCFTLLIACMCLLNLYNSVTGRRLARYRELAVLQSMGMTAAQKRKMLVLENVYLLLRSVLYSGMIVAAFVAALRYILNDRFGRLYFSFPVWVMLITVICGAAALFLFTAMAYRAPKGESLIEEVRTDAV